MNFIFTLFQFYQIQKLLWGKNIFSNKKQSKIFSTLCPSSHLDVDERADGFTLTVFVMTCDSQCSVTQTRGVVGLFAVCDCGISRSYSLAFLISFNCFSEYILGFHNYNFDQHAYFSDTYKSRY